MYHLIENNTKRAFPETVTSLSVMRLPKRKLGESVGFDNGGDIALVLDADGRTLVQYEYRERAFSTDAYLNG
jgi:hypothetical protein